MNERVRSRIAKFQPLTPNLLAYNCPSRWVAEDLASIHREDTPWIVVGLHRMMWAPATWRWVDRAVDTKKEES